MRFVAKYLIYPPMAVLLWVVFVVCLGIAVVQNLTRKAA